MDRKILLKRFITYNNNKKQTNKQINIWLTFCLKRKVVFWQEPERKAMSHMLLGQQQQRRRRSNSPMSRLDKTFAPLWLAPSRAQAMGRWLCSLIFMKPVRSVRPRPADPACLSHRNWMRGVVAKYQRYFHRKAIYRSKISWKAAWSAS